MYEVDYFALRANGLTDTQAFGHFIEAAFRWTPIAQDLNRSFAARHQASFQSAPAVPSATFLGDAFVAPSTHHDPSV
jgi:hypothetical protein